MARKTFILTNRGLTASGVTTDSCFTVLKGSMAAGDLTPSLSHRYAALRERLIGDGSMVRLEDGSLRFARNVTFRSSSQAASVVTGRQSNGLNEWKSRTGTGPERYKAAKRFSSRRKTVSTAINKVARGFEGCEDSYAPEWFSLLNEIASRIEKGRAPPPLDWL